MKLDKPFTDEEKAAFIVTNIYNTGLKYVETDKAIYAIQPNEYIVKNKIVEDNDRYNKELNEFKLSSLAIPKKDLVKALSEQIDYAKLKKFIEADSELFIEWDLNDTFYRSNIIFPAIIKKFKLDDSFIDNIFLNS